MTHFADTGLSKLYKLHMSARQTVERQLYPEVEAGGFSRDDHRMGFLIRLQAVLDPSMTVLDFGAGRGKWHEDPARLRAALGDLRGRCGRIVGADIDADIEQNESVDERVRLDHSGKLPFPDASFDVVSAFSVFEHVEDPAVTASELHRVLKPGGWLIGWTPNRHGYVGVGARLVPDRLKAAVLRRLEPLRQEQDSFPPLYRLNSRGAFAKHLPATKWDDLSYTYNGMPFYHGEQLVLARLWLALFAVLPPPLRAYWLIIMRRRGVEPASGRNG